jgi:hypothetical protein
MTGHIYIGLDFGMALTKVAVWAKQPQERTATRFVVEFPRDNDPLNPADKNRALHLPSALWVGHGRIHGIPAPGTRTLTRIDGIKKLMLAEWSGTPSPVPASTLGGLCAANAEDWSYEKLAILKLAFVLCDVDSRVFAYLSAAHPGARWMTLINAAVPPEQGEFTSTSERTHRMRSVVERAWKLAGLFPRTDAGLPLNEALRLVNSVYNEPLLQATKTPVDVIPEALAAACFQVTSDTATAGNWLTVDVGALTTDISYFFFNPGREYRVACYSSLQSNQVGMDSLAGRSTIIEVKGRPYLPHEALAKDPGLAIGHGEFNRVQDGISQAIRSGLRAAMIHQGSTVAALVQNQTPRWRVLLVGGGSTHPAIAPTIRNWRFEGIGPVGMATCDPASLPRDVLVLGVRERPQFHTIDPADQAILTIAVGLAQRRIDLPKWRRDDPEPRFAPKEPPENALVGHN